MLWRSSLRVDCTAVLGPRSCGRTRYVRCAHCTQTAAASQLTKRAARADLEPALLVATEIAARRVPPAALAPVRFSTNKQRRASKGACGQAGARLWSAEKRRARGRARSAHHQLTCRSLFERSERSERSEFGDGPRDRASQGSRRAAQTAPAKRVSLPTRAFAAPGNARLSECCVRPAPAKSATIAHRTRAGGIPAPCACTANRTPCRAHAPSGARVRAPRSSAGTAPALP